MHVIFVSNCEAKAIKKTRAVLDRYATRIGDRTWVTPITEEALGDVHKALKAKASRNTSVACYRNSYTKEMVLLWTVGNSKRYDSSGRFAMETKSTPVPNPVYLVHAGWLAEASGLCHDFGKLTKRFQKKLVATKKDAGHDQVRHEWISDYFIRELNKSDEFTVEKLDELARKMEDRNHEVLEMAPQSSVYDWFSALSFCVATHHRLFALSGSTPSSRNHISNKMNSRSDGLYQPHYEKEKSMVIKSLGSTSIFNRLVNLVDKLKSVSENEASYWIAVSLLSRAAMILADHHVSSRTVEEKAKNHDDIFANTKDKLKGLKALNQTLGYHLENVGELARRYTKLFNPAIYKGLSPADIDGLLERAKGKCEEVFGWQDQAADFLISKELERSQPTLVMNVASTGAGKTRANMKILAALAKQKGNLRVSSVFNLRSLTLQTRNAYKEFLDEKKIACVIGDPAVIKLADCKWAEDDNEGYEQTEDGIIDEEYQIVGGECEMPEGLEGLSEHLDNREKLVLLSPVLVSTMDQIVAAGEPGKQARHARALARVASSDVIIDEADSYDPKSLVAVLRVVRMAAMCGRNVVVSSATLPPVLAEAIAEEWERGVRMNAAIAASKDVKGRIVMVGDKCQPRECADPGSIKQEYTEFAAANARLISKSKIAVVDRPEVNTGKQSGEIYEALDPNNRWFLDRVLELHKSHNTIESTGAEFSVSIGLIRVAHIVNCKAVAEGLVANAEIHGGDCDVFVTTYHAEEAMVRRHIKEVRMDAMLTRKDQSNPCWWLKDEETKKIVEQSKSRGKKGAVFVIVATPVEEVGRDHDFDWAIIEPSSLTSIIQTAGRVNRHRKIEVAERNILVLLQPFGKADQFYQRPGHRNRESLTHVAGSAVMDVATLLGCEDRRELVVSAGMVFGDPGHGVSPCRFAQEDEKGIALSISRAIEMNKKSFGWMCDSVYKDYPLRESDRRESVWFDSMRLDGLRYKPAKGVAQNRNATAVRSVEWEESPTKGTFLSPGIDECRKMARIAKLEDSSAFSFAVRPQDLAPENVAVISWKGAEIVKG